MSTSHKPWAMFGAGKLTASVWRIGKDCDWKYCFNVFRLNPRSGRVSHRLDISDLEDLLKLIQLLSRTLAEEPSTPKQQQLKLCRLAESIEFLRTLQE